MEDFYQCGVPPLKWALILFHTTMFLNENSYLTCKKKKRSAFESMATKMSHIFLFKLRLHFLKTDDIVD